MSRLLDAVSVETPGRLRNPGGNRCRAWPTRARKGVAQIINTPLRRVLPILAGLVRFIQTDRPL